MVRSGDIPVTDYRVMKSLKNVNDVLNKSSTSELIKKEINNSKIRIGKATRFYSYIDKVEVELSDGEKKLCKVLHHVFSELIDFWTPEGDRQYDEQLDEIYFVPRTVLNCLILDIKKEDSEDWLLLGYYFANDVTNVKIAEPGHICLTNIMGANDYHIDFGEGDLNLLVHDIKIEKGLHKDITNLADEYVKKEDTDLSKYYTKDEIDSKLNYILNLFVGVDLE